MKKTVLIFGLLSGALMSLMMVLVLPFHDQIGFDRGLVVGYTTMVLAFLFIFFGVKSYRDNVGRGTIGFGRGLGETPLEYRRRVEATELLVDGHLERLTGTVVRAAYASRAPSDDDAMDAAADADQVIRDLRRSTPLRRRLFGIYRRD